jgi:ankyrin repeat protein
MWQQRHRTERSEAGRISSPRETRSLFAAIHASATLDVQRLVEEERQDVNQSDALGWSPLHHAAFLGQVKIAEILLRNGANVNAQNRDGYTPLHLAVANSKQKVATLLLKYQADPTIKDFYGRTVMDVSPLENGKITRLIEGTFGSEKQNAVS